MKKAIVTIQPFTIEQTISIFNEAEKVETVYTDVENMINDLLVLKQKYSLNKIVFIGSKHYNGLFGKRFTQAELSQFKANTTEIQYI